MSSIQSIVCPNMFTDKQYLIIFILINQGFNILPVTATINIPVMAIFFIVSTHYKLT